MNNKFSKQYMKLKVEKGIKRKEPQQVLLKERNQMGRRQE